MIDLNQFLANKSECTKLLFDHFIKQFETIGDISIHPVKTIIGIDNGYKRIAWSSVGKEFYSYCFSF